MKKLLVICGPTAIGKTSLGTRLAKQFDGEIVSADSRQVYRGMTIGIGKDLKKLKVKSEKLKVKLKVKSLNIGYFIADNVRLWLLDVVSPKYQFNVVDWLECMEVAIKDIRERGKLPIVVGGAGFYIKALVDGIGSLGIGPDEELRKELAKLSNEELRERLRKMSPATYRKLNESDRNNPRRLIRKIELLKSFIDVSKRRYKGGKRLRFRFLMIGLGASNNEIYKRIDKRVRERLKSGLVDEIKALVKQGIKWSDPGMNSLAYKEFKPFFKKKCSLIEAVERWRFDEHGYARRQMTWFKKDKRIKWFDITKRGYAADIVDIVKVWYSKS